MPSRWGFNQIFGYNRLTGYLYPLFNTTINGVFYMGNSNIPKGLSFGGLDLYALIGHDVAGTWDTNGRVMTIVGFY